MNKEQEQEEEVINYQIDKAEFEKWFKGMYGSSVDYKHSLNLNMIMQSYIARTQIYQLMDAHKEAESLQAHNRELVEVLEIIKRIAITYPIDVSILKYAEQALSSNPDVAIYKLEQAFIGSAINIREQRKRYEPNSIIFNNFDEALSQLEQAKEGSDGQ